MFAHLHLHTEYSLLDGLSRIPLLMERARELGQEAIGLTDHGVLYGAIQFYKEAKARGIRPIIGIEAYVAPASRLSREPGDKQPNHITLLAKNETGYRNLLALVTKAHLEGYYYKPRMDKELFEQHHDGIIALSGCPTSEISRLLMDGRFDEAVKATRYYRDVFADFYVELQEHSIPEHEVLNKRLLQLARETGSPIVATNDVHYVNREDAPFQDILLCIGTNSTVRDENRLKMAGEFGCYCLKSEEEMRRLFPELPEAIDNSWRIAEMCDLNLEFGHLRLPKADVPPAISPEEYLSHLCRQGLARRYQGEPEEARRRLAYELEVVRQTGFADYILVVHDFAQYARERGILMAVRGSAAASIILYCLGVTDIDPLAHRLVFERFLNVERREMPDVDLDFAEDRRDEMIRYAAEKYGHDRVAQIVTFGTLGAKASIRDVGRALGMSYADVDRVARLVPVMPPSFGVMTIDKALQEGQELRNLYEADTQIAKLIDTARELEGVARHASTHAAGVVIAPEPLVNFLPLQRPSSGDPNALPTTQFGMWDVAELGLLKMDFLGLTNLTILGTARAVIRQVRGEDIDLSRLPDGDPRTYEMLARGETFGVFQLESGGMRRYVQELKPTSIQDLAAMVALYRPGPMQHIPTYIRAKHGLEERRHPHPDLADILDETYGVIVYQDQVLLIAQKFAGYSLGQADVMRKAMGKKVRSIMKAEEERFLRGARDRGYTEAQAQEIYNLIAPFAGYAFNKAHAVSYAMIAYQTAYLKANYPEEYMTAVLMMAGGQQRVAEAYAECVRLGIAVLPPDVNHSAVNFALEEQGVGRPGGPPSGRAIRFGLSCVKNAGEAMAEGIVEAREQGGPFASVEDFFERMNIRHLNKRALESLVKAGAFDALAERAALLAGLDKLIAYAQRAQKQRESGQTSLFDLMGANEQPALAGAALEPARAAPQQQKLAWEKELLGIYLSEHPFARAAEELRAHLSCGLVEVSQDFAGRDLVLGGIIAGTRLLTTRDGRSFVAAEIEDQTGSLEVTVWPETFEQTREVWRTGNVIVTSVRVKARDERLQASVQRVVVYGDGPFDPSSLLVPTQANGDNGGGASRRNGGNGTRATRNQGPGTRNLPASTREPAALQIVLEETEDKEEDQERLRALLNALRDYSGEGEVRLSIRQRDGAEVEMELPRARYCPELTQRLGEIVGPWGTVGA